MFIKNGIPLYLQLKEKLLEDIQRNYKVNDLIPAEGKLEAMYKVSRITVRKAIEELERSNVVVKKQGKGTFVKEEKILYDANAIGSLTQRLAKQNKFLSTKSITFEIIKDEHFVKNLLKCETLICIRRTRLLNKIPFALMINYFDINTVPNIEHKLDEDSLYTYLKKEYNIEFFTAEETVEAKAANKSEAKKLEIKEGTPVLSLHRLSSDKKGKAVEYSDLVIKSDMYKHKIMLFSDKVTNV